MIHFLLGILTLSVSTPVSFENAFAPSDWQCGKVTWAEEPIVDPSKLFIGTAIIDCEVTGRSGRGLDGLERALHVRALSADTVIAGPIHETFEEMPGRRFDLRDTDALGSDRVTIDADVVFATDSSTRLVYQSVSRKVKGTGNASYIRKSDLRFDVTPSTVSGKWSFRFTQHTRIQKPPIIGGGAFRNEVIKTIERDAVKQIQATFAEFPSEM